MNVSDEAVGVVADALVREVKKWPLDSSLPWDSRVGVGATFHELARAALAAALPYLAPAGDGGLREALERQLATLPTVAFDNGYPVQALPKSELLSLLALYPAAPAVPQPVDREALRAHLLKAEVVRADGGYWDTPTPQEAGRIADAVLAVSAGEQEQVEPPGAEDYVAKQ